MARYNKAQGLGSHRRRASVINIYRLGDFDTNRADVGVYFCLE